MTCSADPQDLVAVCVTERCQGVGEEWERHGCDLAHQAVTLQGPHLATEAGAPQEADHLGQGVLLYTGELRVSGQCMMTHLGEVLGCAGQHAPALPTLPGVVIQVEAGEGAGPQQAAQVLGQDQLQ